MDYIFINSKKRGNEDNGSIYARIRKGNANRKFAIGFTVSCAEWQKYRAGKFKATDKMDSLGITYGKFANVLEQIRQEMVESFTPDTAAKIIESVRNASLALPVKHKKKCYERKYLLDYWTEYIEQFKDGTRTKKGTIDRVSDSFIRKLSTCQRKIRSFEQACECRLTLEDVDIDLLQEFISFCKDGGIHANTITGYLELFHTFMHRMFEEKHTHNDIYLYSDFVTYRVETDQVYLTTEQIQQMYDLDISSRNKILKLIDKTDFEDDERKELLKSSMTKIQARNLLVARDVFVVGCLTGQRISDYSRINKDMFVTIQGEKFIMLEQKKT